MYAYIQGEVTELLSDQAVIETAGVGYLLFCSQKTLSTLKKGEKARLYTHLRVAEDAVTLYGFHDDTERTMYRRLLLVTRVGPKLALAVLSALTPSDVAAAVVTDDAAAFARVPGMGKKTAQRVLLELKEKVGVQDMSETGLPVKEHSDMRSEAVAALISLGYNGATALHAVGQVAKADSVETLITEALRGMAKG